MMPRVRRTPSGGYIINLTYLGKEWCAYTGDYTSNWYVRSAKGPSISLVNQATEKEMNKTTSSPVEVLTQLKGQLLRRRYNLPTATTFSNNL